MDVEFKKNILNKIIKLENKTTPYAITTKSFEILRLKGINKESELHPL